MFATGNHQDLAIIGFVTALIGFALITYLLVYTVKKSTFQNAFGYFSLSQLVSHLGLLIILLIPVTVEIQWPHLVPDDIAVFFGYFALTFQFTGHYASCLMTVNRFCAVFTPIQYSRWFTDRRGIIYIILSWVLALAQCSIYLLEDCKFTFLGENLHFTFDKTPCGDFVAMYQDFIYNAGLAVLAIIMDMATLVKLSFIWRKSRRNGQRTMFERHQKEFRLFMRTVTAAVMYVLMLTSFHIGSFLTDNKVYLYFFTTYGWEIYLIFSGFTVAMIYDELRQPLVGVRMFFKRKRIQPTHSDEIQIEVLNV